MLFGLLNKRDRNGNGKKWKENEEIISSCFTQFGRKIREKNEELMIIFFLLIIVLRDNYPSDYQFDDIKMATGLRINFKIAIFGEKCDINGHSIQFHLISSNEWYFGK